MRARGPGTAGGAPREDPPGQSPGMALRARVRLTRAPPLSHRRFPSLAPRYKESAMAGSDVFHKFSAFIKNPAPEQDDGEEGPEHS